MEEEHMIIAVNSEEAIYNIFNTILTNLKTKDRRNLTYLRKILSTPY